MAPRLHHRALLRTEGDAIAPVNLESISARLGASIRSRFVDFGM